MPDTAAILGLGFDENGKACAYLANTFNKALNPDLNAKLIDSSMALTTEELNSILV